MQDVPESPTAIESRLRNPGLLFLVGPLLLALLCWAWLVPASLDMYGAMDGLAAWMMESRWDFFYALKIFAMWSVMMAGMMLPSAVPALLTYGAVCRSDASGGSAAVRVYLFASGYVTAWLLFSVAATLLQWQLAQLKLLTPTMEMGNQRLSGAVLIVAGAYQWSAFKRRCLGQCSSPAAFLASHWSRGRSGALRMGVEYGGFCLGCCWALMLLLFVGGVMSLSCILLITVLVLVEKLGPWGTAGARLSGGLLVAAGLYALAGFGLGA